MKVQSSQIWERAFDHSTVTKCLKEFRSGCKNLDDQVRFDRLKTIDSEAGLKKKKKQEQNRRVAHWEY